VPSVQDSQLVAAFVLLEQRAGLRMTTMADAASARERFTVVTTE